MLRVALTGGIATGKSYCLERFARLGAPVIDADVLAREAVASGTPALEAVVHPEVYRRIREWFANLPPGTRLGIADIPLLYETGQEHEFDRVIVAACDVVEQIRRMVVRDGFTDADARARLAAQWPIA